MQKYKSLIFFWYLPTYIHVHEIKRMPHPHFLYLSFTLVQRIIYVPCVFMFCYSKSISI